MIIEKLMMPYILASMHPLYHCACIITCIAIIGDFLDSKVEPC